MGNERRTIVVADKYVMGQKVCTKRGTIEMENVSLYGCEGEKGGHKCHGSHLVISMDTRHVKEKGDSNKCQTHPPRQQMHRPSRSSDARSRAPCLRNGRRNCFGSGDKNDLAHDKV